MDYGPEPEKVVDFVRELNPRFMILGNHDKAVAYGVDCGCGEKTHELSVYTRINISMKLLSEDQIKWLRSLNPYIETELEGKRLVLVHGSPRNPLYEYMLPNLPIETLKLMLSPSTVSMRRSMQLKPGIVIAGHTHIPMDMSIEGVRVLNPGSVGQPRDGDPRASYAILDTEKMNFYVIKVRYDIDKTILKLKNIVTENKVYEKLAKILLTGSI